VAVAIEVGEGGAFAVNSLESCLRSNTIVFASDVAHVRRVDAAWAADVVAGSGTVLGCRARDTRASIQPVSALVPGQARRRMGTSSERSISDGSWGGGCRGGVRGRQL